MTNLIKMTENKQDGGSAIDSASNSDQVDDRPFPIMYEVAPGVPNLHPELTALKPVEERKEQSGHPS